MKPIGDQESRARYGYNIHEMRDIFRTLWARSDAKADIGEYIMGHSIDKLNYNKIFRDVDFAMEEYRKAVPFLNVVSGGLNLEDNQELQDLRERVKDLEREQVNVDDQFVEFMKHPEVQGLFNLFRAGFASKTEKA